MASGAAPDGLGVLAEALRTLKQEYERYFLGLARLVPDKAHAQFKRSLQRMADAPNVNTAYKFRLQALRTALTTHERHWDRTCRAIEEGTYQRDRRRAAALMAHTEVGGALEPPRAAAAPHAPAVPPTAPPQAAMPAAHAGTEAEARMRRLHAAYTAAQRQLGQTQEVALSDLSRAVDSQSAHIRQKYSCQGVDFEVAIREGKVVLKALPRV